MPSARERAAPDDGARAVFANAEQGHTSRRPDGEREMASRGRRMQRIAAGTFADVGRLEAALRELIDRDVDIDRISLVGCAPHLDRLRQAVESRPSDGVTAIALRTRTEAAPGNAEELFALPGSADGLDLGHEWKPQGLLHGLERKLTEGAFAIIVASRTIAEFADATRVLLRHGSHHVRTREGVQEQN